MKTSAMDLGNFPSSSSESESIMPRQDPVTVFQVSLCSFFMVMMIS